MNSLPQKFDPAAEEQASLWAARLEGGTLSATDRDTLDAWLNADPAHRPLLSHYCQFSADLEEQLLALVATGGVTLPPEPAAATAGESEPATGARVRRWNFTSVASVALAAAAAIAVAIWIARPSPRIETVATAAAQRSAITLADGTRVELNARTSLTFENSAAGRRVRLEGGEAFFTVAKDKSRPFVIDAPGGSVRVTGTVFNVHSETPDSLEVTVVEGSVQVRPGAAAARAAEPIQLGAGDCLTVADGRVSKTTLSADALDDALAWRQGQIVFRGVSLRDALERFSRYHGRAIILSPAAAAQDKPVGGRKRIDDLEGFLGDLEASHGVRVAHEPSGTIRVSLRGEP